MKKSIAIFCSVLLLFINITPIYATESNNFTISINQSTFQINEVFEATITGGAPGNEIIARMYNEGDQVINAETSYVDASGESIIEMPIFGGLSYGDYSVKFYNSGELIDEKTFLVEGVNKEDKDEGEFFQGETLSFTIEAAPGQEILVKAMDSNDTLVNVYNKIVDSSGQITIEHFVPVSAPSGKYIFEIYINGEKTTREFNVRSEGITLESIKLSRDQMTVNMGSKYSLNLSGKLNTGEDATTNYLEKVKFSVKDPSIISLEQLGTSVKITGEKVGTTQVIAEVGMLKATCDVTVKIKESSGSGGGSTVPSPPVDPDTTEEAEETSPLGTIIGEEVSELETIDGETIKISLDKIQKSLKNLSKSDQLLIVEEVMTNLLSKMSDVNDTNIYRLTGQLMNEVMETNSKVNNLEDISDKITEIKAMAETMNEKAVENNLVSLKKIRPFITYETDKGVNSIPKAIIDELKANEMDLVIASKDTKIKLDISTLDDIVVNQIKIPQLNRSKESLKKNRSLIFIGQDYYFDVLSKVDGKLTKVKDFATQAKVSIKLNDNQVLDELSIYTYDETSEAWEIVTSQIKDDEIIFSTPHFSNYSVVKTNSEYDDISNHWAENTIKKGLTRGLLEGFDSETFEPDAKVTRGEFAALILNVLGDDLSNTENSFADVSSDMWYANHINRAATLGIVKGVGNDQFKPNAEISRQDLATMIGRTYQVMTGYTIGSTENDFKDASEISPYALAGVNGAVYQSIIQGYPDNTFRPQQNATRAEAVKMVLEILNKK